MHSVPRPLLFAASLTLGGYALSVRKSWITNTDLSQSRRIRPSRPTHLSRRPGGTGQLLHAGRSVPNRNEQRKESCISPLFPLCQHSFYCRGKLVYAFRFAEKGFNSRAPSLCFAVFSRQHDDRRGATV